MQHNNYANAQISAAGLTDEELEFMQRCLAKMGVPEQLLNPPAAPVIDVDVQAAVEDQASGDHDRDPNKG